MRIGADSKYSFTRSMRLRISRACAGSVSMEFSRTTRNAFRREELPRVRDLVDSGNLRASTSGVSLDTHGARGLFSPICCAGALDYERCLLNLSTWAGFSRPAVGNGTVRPSLAAIFASHNF